jgi:CubicO group peptidase (beta-lactamase class C family)
MVSWSTKRKVALTGLMFLFIFCRGEQKKESSKPGQDSLLIKLHKVIEKGTYGNIDSMLVIHKGRIAIDKSYEHDYVKINKGRDASDNIYNYYNPDYHPFYKGSKLHTMQSVTKSVTSAIIGIAVGRGEIPGVSIKVLDYFKGKKILHVDDKKKSMTLEDVLTMRTGISWNEQVPYDNPENTCIQLEASPDWVAFVINRPMDREPGKVYEYNSGASQLLSHIIKESTGMYIDKYAEKYLFGPLGIKNYYWKKTPTGLPDTEGGLYLEPKNLAKIGILYLHDGVWEGKQIVPENWVHAALKPHVKDVAPESETNNLAYGYLWRLIPYRKDPPKYIYTCTGYGGQYMFVLPGHDVIVVFTGWNIYHTRWLPIGRVLFEYILPYAEKAGPPPAASVSR